MSSSHARKRIAAVSVAVPVLLAGGPLVTPAFAAGEYTVESLVANGQVLGPNAGFLGQGIGHNGTTAIFKVSPPADNATVTKVNLVLTPDSVPFSFGSELNAGDGIALYADVDGIANGFSATDKAQGLKSTGYVSYAPDASGNVLVSISLPGGSVSGAPAYYVTARPSLTARALRFRLAVLSDGIAGNAGNGPGTTVSTPSGDNRMIIDAAKPNGGTGPTRTNFTVDQKPAGNEDAYYITPATALASDPDAKLIFFNSASDAASSAVLRRPQYNPALTPEEQLTQLAMDTVTDPSAPTQSQRIFIGDGTGIGVNGAKVAKNNQLSNAVYVRYVDAAGNLSSPSTLSHCVLSGTSCSTTQNGNIVISPDKPETVAFEDGDGNAVAAINVSNEASVPVHVESPSATGAARGSTPTAHDTTTAATKVVVKVVEVGANELADLTKSSDASTLAWSAATDHSIDTRTKVREGRAIAVAYNTDNFGNMSDPKLSLAITKDVTRPTVAVHTPTGAANGAAGDVFSVQFSEPMDKEAIIETPVVSGTGTTERCAVEPVVAGAPPSTVSDVLNVEDGVSGDRTWGYNNCFRWATDGASATIRLGDNTPPGCNDANTQPQDDCTPRAGSNDKVFLAGTLESPVLTDVNGNQALGTLPGMPNTSGFTTIGSLPASPLPGETRDLNADGVLDAIDLPFTLDVDIATIQSNLQNFTIIGNGISVPVTKAEHPSSGNLKLVRFYFGGSFGTGVTPVVKLSEPTPGSGTGVVGKDTRAVAAFTAPTIDKAGPRLKRAVTQDVDVDGYLDRVVVTFSEPIDHAKDFNDTTVGDQTVSYGGYRVWGYEQTTSGTGRNKVVEKEGSGDTKTILLAEKTTGPYDTGATTIRLQFTPGEYPPASGTRVATDSSNNVGGSIDVTVADGTPMRIMSRTTRDLDSNGKLDAIELKFSEILPAHSAGAQIEIDGRTMGQRTTPAADVLRIAIDEIAGAGVGDTGAKPTVKYVSGLKDSSDNLSPADTAPVASADGAGPAIVGACVSSPKGNNGLCPEDDPANDATGNPDKGAKLNVFYSEVVDAASVQAADLKVEQPAGTDKGTATAATTAPSTDGKFSITTLTYAANTLDNLADVQVRFAAVNAITDSATPTKLGNTQVGAVTGTAFPVVTLALTCAVQSAAGTCPELTVGLNASGNSGVTLWRLKETARGTVPAADEFGTTAPGTSYTFPAEGKYTLYLSGKDAYGRLSTEVSQPMYILKAPKISGVEYANSTTARTTSQWGTTTLLDGDSIKIGANAIGTDAAEWAADNAPTGGGCLAQHMAVDIRSITGKSTDGGVAPLSCDLLVGTEQPTRQMRFPTVKATGTTKYPVGTVLKISDTDPGSLVVDGANGTLARRQFISVNARRSWMIKDASVIRVDSHLIATLPRLSKNVGYRDGAILKDATSSRYFYVDSGVKRPVSTTTLNRWRIPTSKAYRPTSTELKRIPTGTAIGGYAHAPGTWIKYTDGRVYQVVRNAQGKIVRRKLASASALSTLVPTGSVTQVYYANSYDSKLPVDSWLRGYRDGTVLRFGFGDFGVVSRGSIRKFELNDGRTFNTMGFKVANALTVNLNAIPRVSGQAYRTGAPIERYALGDVVIKVTNKAGASVTAEVPNATGLFGLGTLDPAPTGWDFTR